MITVICNSVAFEYLKHEKVPAIVRQTYEGPVETSPARIDKTHMTFTIEMVGPGEMTKEQAFLVGQQIINEISSIVINP